MTNATNIKGAWTNEKIHTDMFLRIVLKRAKGRKVSKLDETVYARVTHAAIQDVSAELFGEV